MMDNMAIELKSIFLAANNDLLRKDLLLFINEVSERTICGALMNKICDRIKRSKYSNYFVDVEYNRNKNKRIKTCCIREFGVRDRIININCDLIVHSRGQNFIQDNLIAIEMKKSSRSQSEKNSDRIRLVSLTRDSFNNMYCYDGQALPEHVCRYKLGVYYEINFKKRTILLEYYYKGEKILEEIIRYDKYC